MNSGTGDIEVKLSRDGLPQSSEENQNTNGRDETELQLLKMCFNDLATTVKTMENRIDGCEERRFKDLATSVMNMKQDLLDQNHVIQNIKKDQTKQNDLLEYRIDGHEERFLLIEGNHLVDNNDKEPSLADNTNIIESLNNRELSRDSYSLMIIAEPWSTGWKTGFTVWIIQSGINVLLISDVLMRDIFYGLKKVPTEIPLNISPIVSGYVSAAQVIALLILSFMQDDAFTASLTFNIFRSDSVYKKLLSDIESKARWSNKESSQPRTWWMTIGLPCALKFSEGIVGSVVSCIVIVQNKTILGLFKDLTALVFITELDDLVFSLVAMDHFGRKLQAVANVVEGIKISKRSGTQSWVTLKKSRCASIPLYRRAQICSFLLMLTFFTMVKVLQQNGTFIRRKYPNCVFKSDTFKEWFQLGNGRCDEFYNKASCSFDGSDCFEYNLFFPDCNADIPFKVGDGRCDEEYNTARCRYDPYDCFKQVFDPSACDDSQINVDLLGDGKCDGGLYNTDGCKFDGGDCIDFNDKYPHCKVEKPHLVGNGICDHNDLLTGAQRDNIHFINAVIGNSSLYMSKQCGFDGGDCLNYLFPSCDVDRVDFLNNGICDNHGKYNSEECGFDAGDCLEFNFMYPDCPADYDNWLNDSKCAENVNFHIDGSASCNFGGEDRCFDTSKYPECISLSPPLMSRGYCRPECGHSKENSNCTYFEDKYPHCNATDLSKIGNGICDNSVYNIAECGYEDYDCVDVTLDCHVDRPDWIGDGVCHAGMGTSYNTTECGYDGGDCVETNAMGRAYNCTVLIPHWLGNGECHGFHYNVEECGYDGGDCIETNKNFVQNYPTFKKSFPNCSVADPVLLFDDWCQADWIKGLDLLESHPSYHAFSAALSAYNTSECGYDNGACI